MRAFNLKQVLFLLGILFFFSFSHAERYVIQYCTDDVSSEEMLRGAATQKTEELVYSSEGLLLQEHFYDPFANPKQVNSYYYDETGKLYLMRKFGRYETFSLYYDTEGRPKQRITDDEFIDYYYMELFSGAQLQLEAGDEFIDDQNYTAFFQNKQTELKSIANEHLNLSQKEVDLKMQISGLSTRKTYTDSTEIKLYHLETKLYDDGELVFTATENMLSAPEIISNSYKFFELSRVIFSKSYYSSYGTGGRVESNYKYNKQGDLEELSENVYANRGIGSHHFTKYSNYSYNYDDRDRVIDYVLFYEEKPLSLRSDSVSYRYCRYEYN